MPERDRVSQVQDGADAEWQISGQIKKGAGLMPCAFLWMRVLLKLGFSAGVCLTSKPVNLLALLRGERCPAGAGVLDALLTPVGIVCRHVSLAMDSAAIR